MPRTPRKTLRMLSKRLVRKVRKVVKMRTPLRVHHCPSWKASP